MPARYINVLIILKPASECWWTLRLNDHMKTHTGNTSDDPLMVKSNIGTHSMYIFQRFRFIICHILSFKPVRVGKKKKEVKVASVTFGKPMVNGTVRTAKILEIFFISPAAGLPSILACYTDEKLDVRELENRSNKVSIMQNQVRQREKEKGGEGRGGEGGGEGCHGGSCHGGGLRRRPESSMFKADLT